MKPNKRNCQNPERRRSSIVRTLKIGSPGSDGADLGAHRRRQPGGIRRGPHDDADVGERAESIRHVRHRQRRRVVVHLVLLDVGRHADHREPFGGLGGGQTEARAHRIGIRPQFVRHGVVDHRHGGLARALGIGEVAALQHRQAHRLLQMRRHADEADERLFALRHGAPVDDDVAAAAARVERNEVRRVRRLHARQAFNPPHDVFDALRFALGGARRPRPSCRTGASAAARYRSRGWRSAG